MAKTTAPALSFGAAGAIGKTMVYSKWRGVKYVRQHVIPANPKTALQTGVRTRFAFLREIFKLGGTLLLDPWNAFASGRPFTGMNKFVGENIRVLNGMTDLDRIIISPGAGGGLPPTSLAVTSPVAGEAHIIVGMPTLPSGWTVVGMAAIALKQQDPSGIFDGGVNEAAAAGPSFDTVNITGLTTGATYVVGVYLKQQAPNGNFAYSVSLTDTVVIA